MIECPICMDSIELTNRVTTECGHCFHTSCLMQNVAHNGFGCPYCRTKLAEEPEEEDDDVWTDDEEVDEPFEDSALNGMRWLFMRSNGEEIPEDEQDIQEEVEDEEVLEPETPKPSVSFVTQKLIDQGVTMEQLVKIMLSMEHEEYYRLQDEADRAADRIFGKCRIIISNYRPEQETVVTNTTATTTTIDADAQPKIQRANRNITVRNTAIDL